MSQPLLHPPMSQFQVQDNALLINGIPVERLTQRIGQTPYYAYDRSVIAARLAKLNSLFPDVSIHYAIKANPMPALVDFIASRVDGLDVASGKELIVALNSGINADKISFAGPGKSEHELSMAIAAGITINLESETELARISRLQEILNLTAKVSLRVNPDFELKTSGMKMGGGAQQFGIDSEMAARVINDIVNNKIDFRGLHIFTGSQNLNCDAIINAHEKILALAKHISDQSRQPLATLNIGGGFGIPYFPGEKPLNLQPIAENLSTRLKRYHRDFENTEIILELGRYLVGEAGVFVCRVSDLKTSRGQHYAVVDGGLHHHLSASGNFGQVIRKNYPLAVANKMEQQKVRDYHIVGPLCTPLDILGKSIFLPELEIGDLIVIYQSGAYGFTASPRDFLSHASPIEALV